jgi:hypothetical protein
MQSNRLSVKIYAATSAPLEHFIPAFHRWIREKVLDELVIDVADYGHVQDGPSVLLVGHASDYCWDQSEGRFGVTYTRKRDAPAPAERLTDAVRRALNAARLLEREPGLEGLRFKTDEVLLRALDRLHAPPDANGFAELKAELEPFAARLFPSGGATVERDGEARDPLSARIRASSGAASVDELLSRVS